MLNDDEFLSTYGIYDDLVLEADWEGTQYTYYSSTTITISNEYVIINLKNASVSSSFNFTISESVKSVSFLGAGKSFNNMRINISSREGALILGFDSISFKPAKSTTGTGYNAVNSTGNFTLYVIYKGECNITGGEGKDGTSYYTTYDQATNNNAGENGVTGGAGSNGGYGIKGYKINFSEYDEDSSIVITGGKGGVGGRGGNGQQGSNGHQQAQKHEYVCVFSHSTCKSANFFCIYPKKILILHSNIK